MTKRRIASLLFSISIAMNIMVFITWIITNSLGYDLIDPFYLFRNIIASIALVSVNMIFSWFYSENRSKLVIGSLQFLFAVTTFVIFGLWAYWFPFDIIAISISVSIFTIIFLVIWLAYSSYWKSKLTKNK